MYVNGKHSPHLRLLFGSEDGAQVVPNDSRGLGSIDTLPETLGLVVVGNWASLGVVGLETARERLSIVVGALNERFSSEIIDTSLLGRATKLVSHSLTLIPR